MMKTAIAAFGLLLASAAQATTSCVDSAHAPLEGQSNVPLPTGFEPCDTGALIAKGDTNIWRCKVQPGFEDKVGATYLVVIEQGGRIVATERDDMEQGPLDALRWYEVDFDRDGTHEHVVARRVMETPAHAIQQWRVSIHSADWSKVITSFDGVEDFGPDAMFRDSPDEGCLILQTRYEALPGEGEQLALKGSLWAIVDDEPVALAEEPEPRVLDAAFIAERQQAPYPDDYMRTPFRWLYARDHEAEQAATSPQDEAAAKLLGAVRGYVLLGEACREPLGNDLADAFAINARAALERLGGDAAAAQAFVKEASEVAAYNCAGEGPCWRKYFDMPDATDAQGFAACATAAAQAQEDFSTIMVTAMTMGSSQER